MLLDVMEHELGGNEDGVFPGNPQVGGASGTARFCVGLLTELAQVDAGRDDRLPRVLDLLSQRGNELPRNGAGRERMLFR